MSKAVPSSSDPMSCCTPPPREIEQTLAQIVPAFRQVAANAVKIPGGECLRGTDTPMIATDREGPVQVAELSDFLISPTTVSNQEFQSFVDATGYVTEAERFGWSFVFYTDLPASIEESQGVVGTQWWRIVNGANWQDIHGPGTQATSWHAKHPVVQVSWNDARAYAQWVGGRLPTEAEWEHAARGGLGDVPFPWGKTEPDDKSFFPCNIWQGSFPDKNSGADGWRTTAPVDSFKPNGYGMYNMVGNVWEWTEESFQLRLPDRRKRNHPNATQGLKLLKGGSFLCHRSYCYRYRIAARIGNSPDSTTTHQGFRVVWDKQDQNS